MNYSKGRAGIIFNFTLKTSYEVDKHKTMTILTTATIIKQKVKCTEIYQQVHINTEIKTINGRRNNKKLIKYFLLYD